MPNPNEDYYGWTQETVEKLRQGRISEVNMADLIEELEDMGKSEKRELRSRLITLIGHLLKWQYQADRRVRSWRATIIEQREGVKEVLEDNPSLKPRLEEFIKQTYPRGVQLAVKETEIDEGIFPATFEQTGWSWEQVLDGAFYPD